MSPPELHDTPSTETAGVLRIDQVGMEQLDVIRRMNRIIFEEERIINTFDREDITIFIAYVDDEPVGFKLGYRESRTTFYSAKGGVLPGWRRQGISRTLLHVMMDHVRENGYRRFAYDTFPNKHPGMTVLGLDEGFTVTRADYNSTYKDYRLRFEKKL